MKKIIYFTLGCFIVFIAFVFYLLQPIQVNIVIPKVIKINKIEKPIEKVEKLAEKRPDIQVIPEKSLSEKVIDEINRVRLKNDRSVLIVNEYLNKSATDKATKLINLKLFSHDIPEHHSISDGIKKTGYRATWYGENLACGYDDAVELVDVWMKSELHRNILLDKDFVDIGIAFGMLEKSNTYKCFLTVLHLGG